MGPVETVFVLYSGQWSLFWSEVKNLLQLQGQEDGELYVAENV